MNKKILALGTLMSAGLLMSGATNAEEKRFDVRVSPLVLLVGAVDMEANMKVTDQITVGPTFTYWGASVGDYELTIAGYGARANWHQQGAYKNGFYASAYAKMWSFDTSSTSFDIFSGTTTSVSGSTSAALVGVLGGYLWQWDSLNLSLGAGYALGTVGDTELKDSNGVVQDTFSGSSAPIGGIAVDAAVGWAF